MFKLTFLSPLQKEHGTYMSRFGQYDFNSQMLKQSLLSNSAYTNKQSAKTLLTTRVLPTTYCPPMSHVTPLSQHVVPLGGTNVWKPSPLTRWNRWENSRDMFYFKLTQLEFTRLKIIGEVFKNCLLSQLSFLADGPHHKLRGEWVCVNRCFNLCC